MKYQISVNGCDATTNFEMELTDDEVEIVKRVAAKCTETSTYSCMPTIDVEPADEVTK